MTIETALSIVLAVEMIALGIFILAGFRREATLRRNAASHVLFRGPISNRAAQDRELRRELAALRKEFHREIDRVHSDLIKVALGRTSPRF